ncbi:hypothetical protein [Hafnia paralvei]|uniref:hypothetical protein n=1 Tax=Hafnia paralvei TaxID=546367 RepID=UPI00300D6E88
MRKEHKGSFASETKEHVIGRIASLANKYPSRSAAARAWGVNINTLNSYFKHDTPPPMPRENLLVRIALCEGVSLEWLKYGSGDSESIKTIVTRKIPDKNDQLSQMLEFLTEEERMQLAMMLARKGVETVLYLLDEDNIKLLKLDRVMKEKVLGLQPRTPEEAARIDEEARECGADNKGDTIPQSLTSKNKRVG